MLVITNIAANDFAYKSFSLGVGIFTEEASKIEEDATTNEVNSFETNPFLKAVMTYQTPFEQNLLFEVGVSTFRESRDTMVTRINYWGNILLQNYFLDETLSFNYGLGMFFTTLSMDGQTQTLNNGGVEKDFATPSGSSTASNLTANAQANYYAFGPDFYLSLDVSILNIEDSMERAFNYFFAINFELDKVAKPTVIQNNKIKNYRR